MILSADDFGLSPAVDEGILSLIENDRISSTSCMLVTGNLHLTKDLNYLSKFSNKVDVGLHLVLTDFKPTGKYNSNTGMVDSNGRFLNLGQLVIKSYLGLLSQNAVENEIIGQLDLFKSHFGRFPDFIDGHKHIQQLPKVKNALATIVHKIPEIKYVRVANLPNRFIGKMMLSGFKQIALENYFLTAPGRAAADFFDSKMIPHNRYLLGYYKHEKNISFKFIFRKYLELGPNENDIFFCHPGYCDDFLKSVDKLTLSRQDNLDFLLSREFVELCDEHEIKINRFRMKFGSELGRS